MTSLIVLIALLALFAYSTTAIELKGCQRGIVSVMTAGNDTHLSKEIEEKLGFSTSTDDIIVQVTVRSRDLTKTFTATFVGRNEDGKTIAYEFEVRTDTNSELTIIPLKTFFNYLQCEQVYFKSPKPNPSEQVEDGCCA